MTPTAKTKQKARESLGGVSEDKNEHSAQNTHDESPMQPVTTDGDGGDSQTQQAAGSNKQNNSTSSILSASSKYTRKANIGKIGGMSTYIDYKTNKDAKKLLHVILNDLDKKWDAKALMFKQVAKAQRSLRKKTEEEYRVLSQKYHRLISDYDLLKKTSEDDLQMLRLHLHEADNRLQIEHTQHTATVNELKEAHEGEIHQLSLAHHALDSELSELRAKNSEYLETIYHLDQGRLSAEARLVEQEGEVAVTKNHFDAAVRECEQLRVTLGTARDELRESEATIASLKGASEVQKLLENFNPLTALLSLVVLYLAACVVGLAADPIKIVMISTGIM